MLLKNDKNEFMKIRPKYSHFIEIVNVIIGINKKILKKHVQKADDCRTTN